MADRNALEQMKAKQFFTRNSPKTGAILHGDDRDNADVQARFPRVTPEDADFLEREGLAERYDGRVPRATSSDGSGMTVGERAGEFAGHHLDADQSVDRSTGLDTRQSTVFEKPIEEMAGEGGHRRVLEAFGGTTPLKEAEAPTGGGKRAKTGDGGETEPTPYRQMKTADLKAEAEKEPKVDLSSATNNEQRAILIEQARGNKAPAAATQ